MFAVGLRRGDACPPARRNVLLHAFAHVNNITKKTIQNILYIPYLC